MHKPARGSSARQRWYVLLLLPFIFMLWPSLYNKVDPTLAGVPFFYWYQFIWVALSGAITWVVYLLVRTEGP